MFKAILYSLLLIPMFVQAAESESPIEEVVNTIAYAATDGYSQYYITKEGHAFIRWEWDEEEDEENRLWKVGQKVHLMVFWAGAFVVENLDTGEATYGWHSVGGATETTYYGRSIFGPVTIDAIEHRDFYLVISLSNGTHWLYSYDEEENFELPLLWKIGDQVHVTVSVGRGLVSDDTLKKALTPFSKLTQIYNIVNISHQAYPYSIMSSDIPDYLDLLSKA